MELFDGVIKITGVSFLMFSIMAIIALGYLLGRITIKGISLGTAGVFVVALLYGALFYQDLTEILKSAEITSNGLKIIENLGLIFFVTSVGFIAGPKFFLNLKKTLSLIFFSALSLFFRVVWSAWRVITSDAGRKTIQANLRLCWTACFPGH